MLLRDGKVELDGSTQEAIARYHRLLADERDPEESAAGLREYGSGEVRIDAARLLGPEGEERLQLAAGEPLTVELRIDGARGGAAAEWSRSSCATRPGCCSPPPRRTPRSSAGRRRRASGSLRFAVDRPPLADGRFRLRFEVGDRDGRRLYHWLDDAVRFVVYPGEAARGPVLLVGTLVARTETGGR